MAFLISVIFVFPIHLCLQLLNLAWWGSLIIVLGVVKFMLPIPVLRNIINPIIANFEIAFAVVSVSFIRFFNRINIDYRIKGELSKQHWYLITANHRSYLDVILVMEFAYQRIPAPKFFLKQELIWLPFIGLGAWALEMPFMRRYSKAQIKANPELAAKDIETTKERCQRYRQSPTTIVNFAEGTRFTPQKHADKHSPFRHLLRPKAGGLAFTLATMGDQFDKLIDITIVYPGNSSQQMFDMLRGKMKQIIIDVNTQPVPQDLVGNYEADTAFKAHFQNWLNAFWHEKDQRLHEYMTQTSEISHQEEENIVSNQ